MSRWSWSWSRSRCERPSPCQRLPRREQTPRVCGQAQEEVPPARRERTLSRSIMKPQPEAEAGGAAEPPAETEAARRPRTKSVVWKDATPPKKAPKGTPRAELSTVVTFPREPGTNARKLVRGAPRVFVCSNISRAEFWLNFGGAVAQPRRAQPQPERRTCLCTVLYGLVILAICGGVVAVLMLGDSGTR